MNTHIMGLNPEALLLIKNGTKTIEMRLYDKKRQAIKKKDYIIFIDTEKNKNKLKVIVKNMYVYENFEELYKEFNKIILGYKEDEVAYASDMEKYYSTEYIKKYGVVAIEVETIM